MRSWHICGRFTPGRIEPPSISSCKSRRVTGGFCALRAECEFGLPLRGPPSVRLAIIARRPPSPANGGKAKKKTHVSLFFLAFPPCVRLRQGFAGLCGPSAEASAKADCGEGGARRQPRDGLGAARYRCRFAGQFIAVA